MSVIARPRWAGQPSRSIIVDWENPLARRLVTAIVPACGPKNLAGYERTFFGSTVSAAGGVQGRQVSIIKQTGTQIGIRVSNSVRQRTSETTGFVLFRRTGTVDANTDVWWKNWQSNSAPSYISWTIAVNNGGFGQNNINAIVGVSGGVVNSAPYTAPSLTNWTTAAIVKRSDAHDLYVNGLLRNTTTSGAITYGSSGDNDLLTNISKTQPLDIAVALTWGRALTATEIAFLSVNPWQIFVPQRRVIYSIPVSNNVTATIAPTQAADTASVGATVTNRASLAPTQAADTAASSVAVINRAAIAATQAPDVAASTVTIAAVATIAATQAQDVAASSVTITNQVSIAATQAADTAAITVALGVDATIAATQAPDSASSSVTVIDRVVIAATQAPDNAAVTGVITNRVSIAATQAADTAAIAVTALVPIDAIISATQAPDTAVVIVDVESSMQAGVGVSGVVNLANTSDGGALYIGAKNVPLTDPPGANVGDGGVVDRFAGILPVTTVYIVVEVDTGYVLQEDDSKIVLEQS